MFFSDPTIAYKLLDVAQGEGWLIPSVVPKVRLLLEQGLHPEQVLVGLGLISREEYGEALAQVCQLPFVVTTPAAKFSLLDPSLLARAHAQLVERGPDYLLIAFADPSNTRARQAVASAVSDLDLNLRPVVTLFSPLRQSCGRVAGSASVASLRRHLEHCLSTSDTVTADVADVGAHWQTTHHGLQACPHTWREDTPSSAASALGAHLERVAEHLPWQITRTSQAHGTHVQLRRYVEEQRPLSHPLGWTRSLSQPGRIQGVLLFLNLDHLARQELSRYGWKQARHSDHWRVLPDEPHLYDLATQAEEALHAALSGRAVIVLADELPQDWLAQLTSARVPITTHERLPTISGSAWIVYDHHLS